MEINGIENFLNTYKIDTGSESNTTETNQNLSFDSLLGTVDSIENNQIETQNSIYTMLKTGVGDTHDALIAMNKATSQIKTASVIRDKGIESYQTIMSMQV